MKTIIAGGRDFDQYNLLVMYADTLDITEVVCGMARGADLLGHKYGDLHGIPITEFPADWKTHGKAAGYIRNKQMGDYADVLLAFWDGKSKGTKSMIDYMDSLEKPILVVGYKNVVT